MCDCNYLKDRVSTLEAEVSILKEMIDSMKNEESDEEECDQYDTLVNMLNYKNYVWRKEFEESRFRALVPKVSNLFRDKCDIGLLAVTRCNFKALDILFTYNPWVMRLYIDRLLIRAANVSDNHEIVNFLIKLGGNPYKFRYTHYHGIYDDKFEGVPNRYPDNETRSYRECERKFQDKWDNDWMLFYNEIRETFEEWKEKYYPDSFKGVYLDECIDKNTSSQMLQCRDISENILSQKLGDALPRFVLSKLFDDIKIFIELSKEYENVAIEYTKS